MVEMILMLSMMMMVVMVMMMIARQTGHWTEIEERSKERGKGRVEGWR